MRTSMNQKLLELPKLSPNFQLLQPHFCLTTLYQSQPSKLYKQKKLDFSMVSTLVKATLKSLEDVTPASNWVLELIECSEHIQNATRRTFDTSKIKPFQDNIALPYIAHLQEIISSSFSSSHDVVSSLSIFNPNKVPPTT